MVLEKRITSEAKKCLKKKKINESNRFFQFKIEKDTIRKEKYDILKKNREKIEVRGCEMFKAKRKSNINKKSWGGVS